MKDIDQKDIEIGRPTEPPLQVIKNALDTLYRDQSRSSSAEVVPGLRFEELLGALLVGRDAIEQQEANLEP